MVKLLYKPLGLLISVLGGIAASAVFARVWKRCSPVRTTPPTPPTRTVAGPRS
jgi:hypothetical protein